MITVIDSRTGKEVAQVMGDALSVAQSFMSEAIKDGATCSMVKRRYGYLIQEHFPGGTFRNVYEVRNPEKPNHWRVGGVIFLIFVALVVAELGSLILQILDRAVGIDKTLGKRGLFNPF